MEHCLYHEDKSTFEQVQKFLQSSSWIPRQYAHRLAMAICSCRKFKGEVEPAVKLQTQQEFLDEYLKLHTGDNKPQAPGALLQWIAKFLDHGDNYSHARLVTILYNAVHKDFQLLQRENVSSNKMDVLIQKKNSGQKKLNASQRECLIKKRKKKYVSQVVKLNMFPGNRQRLEQSLDPGVLKTNKGYLDFPRDLNDRSFDNNTSITYVKVWSKDTSSLNSITTILRTNSQALQKKLDSERLKRQAWRSFIQDYYEETPSNFKTTGAAGNEKDQLSADFELKSWKQSQAKSQPKKPVCAALQGGHCLQCLRPYSSLKDTSTCTYHPGYLNPDGVWSCCSEESDLDSHAETGCMTSAQHMWRPHAKRSRSEGKKVTYTDTQFARSRHIKHRYERHRK